MTRLRILALEPYYGGSHRAVLDGLVARIDAEWTLLTLPARKWKWRMRGSAISMAAQARAYAGLSSQPHRPPFDLIFASTFLNLAEFRGLAGPAFADVPAIVYFHENQLVYPNRHNAEWDLQFPLTNVTSALAADACIFNSSWNLERFIGEIPDFIRQFPDCLPQGLAQRIAEKSQVIAPPFDPAAFDDATVSRSVRTRIVWPHRWEHDKDPEAFFNAVMRLADEGLDFEVAIAGQSFRETDGLMRDAAACLGKRLVHCDEPASRAEYASLLSSADVAVSTARNEFFGIAMIEAAYAGCTPVVPDRLAYTELYASRFRYHDEADLVDLLRGMILVPPPAGQARAFAEQFTFDRLVGEYRDAFTRVAHSGAH